jgi:MFS transporter, SP family, general alpha glucoside:H+ symporter
LIYHGFLTLGSLNPSAWNLRGKGGFIWCGFTLISFVWSYFRLPETRGLSAGQIDLLFTRKVPARKFQTVEADPFRSVKDDTSPVLSGKAETVVEKETI